MDEHCNSCGQKDRCQEVYAKLGRSHGPNIAAKAVIAFVVPVVVFVGAALLTQILLKNTFENAALMVLTQFVAGLIAAGFIVLALRCFSRQDSYGQPECPEKEK